MTDFLTGPCPRFLPDGNLGLGTSFWRCDDPLRPLRLPGGALIENHGLNDEGFFALEEGKSTFDVNQRPRETLGLKLLRVDFEPVLHSRIETTSHRNVEENRGSGVPATARAQ